MGSASNDCMKMEVLLKSYYLPAMYGIEFILGIVGCVTAICSYIFILKEWKSGNVYLFNLSVSDLMFICTLPSLITTYAQKLTHKNDDFWCLSNRYILHLNLYSSILFLTWVSIDRYLLLKYPLRHHVLQKTNSAVVISALIWIVVTFQIMPILTFLVDSDNSSSDTNCKDFASSGNANHSLIYSLCLTFTGYIVPLTVLCFFYMKIVKFLKSMDRNFQNNDSFKRPVTLVFSIVIVFIVLQTPYHIMRNVRIASRVSSAKYSECDQIIINSLYIVTRPLAFFQSAINPLFYFLMGDRLRESLFSKVRAIFIRIQEK
ncbi:succinate receptor 1-like [Polypterus senegalus]|uniref:succinate receptor 1-like n=1 Tax=Polypterus senegalus TaxID=55291 RepID=UPI001962C4BA|nr:succinate receptor 1-like [Polypterus senegalus]